MADNFFKRLTVWQNWAHYALLSIILAIPTVINSVPSYQIFNPEFVGLIPAITLFVPVLSQTIIPTIKMALMLAGADTLIHGLFWIAPKPIRWRD